MTAAAAIGPAAPAAGPAPADLRPLLALVGPQHARAFAFAGARVYGQAADVAGVPVDPPPLVHEYSWGVNGRWLCVSLHAYAPFIRTWRRDTQRELPPAVAVKELIG